MANSPLRSRSASIAGFVAVALLVGSADAPTAAPETRTVVVNPDGSFTPKYLLGSALTGISVSQAASKSCALGLSFRGLPGQTDPESGLGLYATLSGPTACATPTLVGTAKLTTPQHFVRGVRVCTSGVIPRLMGVDVFGATVEEDGAVHSEAQSRQQFATPGCTWSPPRFCPIGQVAVGVQAHFTDGGGFSGLSLQCRAFGTS